VAAVTNAKPKAKDADGYHAGCAVLEASIDAEKLEQILAGNLPIRCQATVLTRIYVQVQQRRTWGRQKCRLLQVPAK
jgi:hypothetical protein